MSSDYSPLGSGAKGENKNLVLVFLAFSTTLFASGVVFGWPSLKAELEREGFYNSMCQDVAVNESCAAKDNYLTLIYTVAQSLFLACALPWGYFLDYFGPRYTCTLSTFTCGTGMLLIALATKDRFDGIMPGLALVGIGGSPALQAVMHVCNLFPEKRAAIVGINQAGFQFAYLIFAISNFNVPNIRQINGFVIAACIFSVSAGSWSLWPDKPFQLPETEADVATKSVATSGERTPTPLLGQILTLRFAGITAWTCVNIFWLNFYMISENLKLRSLSDNEKMVNFFLSLYVYMLPIGAFVAYPFGRFVDKFGLKACMIATTAMFTFYSLLQLVPILEVQVLTFVAYGSLRVMAFAALLVCLLQSFGLEHFGKLVGVVSFVSGIVNLLFYAIPATPSLTRDLIQLASLAISGTIFCAVFDSLNSGIYGIDKKVRSTNERSADRASVLSTLSRQ